MEFEKLLVAIFGQDFIDTFKTHRPAGYVDLMIAFESRKRAATPHKTNPLNVSLPFSFIDYYKKYKVLCYNGIVVTMLTVVCYECYEMVPLRQPRKCQGTFDGPAVLWLNFHARGSQCRIQDFLEVEAGAAYYFAKFSRILHVNEEHLGDRGGVTLPNPRLVTLS